MERLLRHGLDVISRQVNLLKIGIDAELIRIESHQAIVVETNDLKVTIKRPWYDLDILFVAVGRLQSEYRNHVTLSSTRSENGCSGHKEEDKDRGSLQ